MSVTWSKGPKYRRLVINYLETIFLGMTETKEDRQCRTQSLQRHDEVLAGFQEPDTRN